MLESQRLRFQFVPGEEVEVVKAAVEIHRHRGAQPAQIQGAAQLLPELPLGALAAGLSGVHAAAYRHVPQAGPDGFSLRPVLNQHPALGVKEAHMHHGAVLARSLLSVSLGSPPQREAVFIV